MPKLGYFEIGNWNAQCDECGRPFKFSDLRLRWDKAWVCNTGSCWEPRQPQDFQRGIKDDSSVPVGRPRILPVDTITTLAANLASSGLSLTVATGDGTNFPAAPFQISITDQTTPTIYEYITVGGHVAGSDSFTSLTRGALNTQVNAFTAGALVTLII